MVAMHQTCMFLVLWTGSVLGRIHELKLEHDSRRYFPLSTFGFLTGGDLIVNITSFQVDDSSLSGVYGFTLDRTMSDAVNPYLDGHMTRCTLASPISSQDTSAAIIYFTFDLKQKRVLLNCSRSVADIVIEPVSSRSSDEEARSKRDWLLGSLAGSALYKQRHRRLAAAPDPAPVSEPHPEPAVPGQQRCAGFAPILLQRSDNTTSGLPVFSTAFVIHVLNHGGEGLYNLFFHNCPNYQDDKVHVSMTVEMSEQNMDSYLSAGEMPLPALYFMMSVLFFISSCFWLFILKKSNRADVYKTHYVMSLLGYMKALSLLFHGINYHVIEVNGFHMEAWAILFYITHLMKGALLFVTIILLGTGWTFIKHVLADRDKKLFMIVIPLQLLANVAQIILEESEEGDSVHTTWREMLYLLDLVCCGAILFPVVWSIRHLQDASETDGKAAMNLKKLKLFRHFYIMIVCYIYFTRIVVYLLQIMVPFQYEWLDDMFREMATYVFFAVTAYKFRPADSNPYFQVPLSDDEQEMDEVLTESGVTEGLSRVRNRAEPSDAGAGDEDETQTLSKRESSHDYD
ncbi:protein GPR107-like [Pollicipes pollicipes]|uniref:protein GPR107-like n=1 Tax=Pollicipes pollicipes TaxID=41117 RepID=UPI0018849DDD|nr:protein GPR107-like [Pollicipes pollicipes]XP_037080044.1 protein GPR107-like [Pollicipes pollicipes]XP_037080045.1 protein GPR107-like [Pollicipes pollicipes]XP_037080046.1 protein GPR107-like [Pollicipes pollicipes]